MDADMRVLETNVEGAKLMGNADEISASLTAGRGLKCVQARHPDGCGKSEQCRTCVIRKAVDGAAQGLSSRQQKTTIQRVGPYGTELLQFLVTATPFEFKNRKLSLVVLEDITELMRLRAQLPMCGVCRKVRDERDHWHRMETYLADNFSLSFTLGLCPECHQTHLPTAPPSAGR